MEGAERSPVCPALVPHGAAAPRPSGASPLSPRGSLFQWGKEWAPSGARLVHLSPRASPSCLSSRFPGQRAVTGLGVRGRGGCRRAEWVWRAARDSEPGGPEQSCPRGGRVRRGLGNQPTAAGPSGCPVGLPLPSARREP